MIDKFIGVRKVTYRLGGLKSPQRPYFVKFSSSTVVYRYVICQLTCNITVLLFLISENF